MMSELTVLDPSAGLKAKKSDALRKTWCEWEGRGGDLVSKSPPVEKTSTRRSGYGGSVLFMDKRGVVMNEPYLNIPIAGFRADWWSSKNKILPH